MVLIIPMYMIFEEVTIHIIFSMEQTYSSVEKDDKFECYLSLIDFSTHLREH